MADSKEFLHDPNLLTELTAPPDPILGDHLFPPETDNMQMLDSFLNNESLDTGEAPSADALNEVLNEPLTESDPMGSSPMATEEKEPEKELSCNSNSSEEHHVESPTATAEGFAFKCIYCDRALTAADNPKLLECLHNSCTNCINSKLFENNESSGSSANQISCPTCNIHCDPTRIIENQFLIELANNEESNASKQTTTDLKCSSCSDEAPASSYCADCSEFICDNCVQAHQRLKITKDHTIKSKEDGINELNALHNGAANLFCSVHPHEKLSLFCETCDKLTCRDCQLIEHREHKYKFTNEIASEAKKYISDMLKDVGYKRALLTSAMKVIDDRQNLITEKKQALVKEITQLVVKLTQTISTRGKHLVGKLTEVCDSKQKTLQEKKLALEQLSKMTDHCIDFTQYALDNGSDMALLYSKKQVTEHLKRIKCKRADIPNPEIPVRIHLALDKVPDLIKVMSTIGQIVVDGRVYPSQATSPGVAAYPPNQSPSPQLRPPQQQSPISPLVQQPSPSGFMQNQQQQQPQQQVGIRMGNPPPYNQYQGNNQQYPQMMQNMGQSNIPQQFGQNSALQNRLQSMGPPPTGMNNIVPQAIPISLAQQLNRGMPRVGGGNGGMQRSIIPRMPSNSPMGGAAGLNQQQQQVSSSTHPHGMMQDRSNLRHLLQPNGNSGPIYIQTGPSQYQAIQPHQFQNRFPGNQQPIRFNQQQPQQVRMLMSNQQGQNRMIVQNQQPQNRPQQQQQQFGNVGPGSGGAKWHTPQQTNDNQGNSSQSRNSSLPTINDNFKITLRQQPETNNKSTPATVTSTIPKTPSPNHIQGGHQETAERSLDKFCEESVKDLMATIAKLDSNGVQVLAEGRQKGGSPHVDSSTGDATPAPPKIKAELMDTSKDDPNEDWCAVCSDGGELVCCDKCPKVFHQYCHIPNLSVEENDTWQCLLCMNFADIPETVLSERKDGELSVRERKIAERLVLELYCQYETSLPFREIIGPENVEYHQIIKKPIALDVIRQKLNWNTDSHYKTMEQLVRDVRLMFKNAYTFNPVDSQIYADAKTLEKFFDEQLEKFLPDYAYETFEGEGEVGEAQPPPAKKYRRVVTD
ncbi:E3 ubiquitin-protein ligase TRIM33 [Anthonomus grandis grandis]|uniref:E3 ubiquitin-protein ligase TRIM33 n=1 Tax=Anthonomus grandis grandis TaxID=2921223 RepID=UPI0021656B45|nr:E3 ubiquitin-protein ligase TRIM33 [Anthonomus grandis grandis]